MGTAERRLAIMKLLCRRRQASMQSLADEFVVSRRTLQRDIEVLSLSNPIYTKSGRHGGGVYVIEGYYIDRMYMKDEEIALLSKIITVANEKCLLTQEEKEKLAKPMQEYTKPKEKITRETILNKA